MNTRARTRTQGYWTIGPVESGGLVSKHLLATYFCVTLGKSFNLSSLQLFHLQQRQHHTHVYSSVNGETIIYLKYFIFFLDFCRLLGNFQSSEDVSFDSLCQGSCCFYGVADFWRFLLHHSRSASSSLFTFSVIIVLVRDSSLSFHCFCISSCLWQACSITSVHDQ